MSRSLAIDYVGHSTLLVELEGIRFLTDPATRDRIGPLARVAAGVPREGPRSVDVVLVSHLHRDHLDLPSLRALGSSVRVVAPRGAASWLRQHGVREVVELASGESTDVGGVTVRAVPARHGGYRPLGGPTAEAIGYVLDGRSSVYFAGDTGLFPGLATLAGTVDVALLPVWGWGPTLRLRDHLDPRAAARAAALIRPRFAVPIHWGTYWPAGFGWLRPRRLTDPPLEFSRAVAELAPAVRVRATAVGEVVDLT